MIFRINVPGHCWTGRLVTASSVAAACCCCCCFRRAACAAVQHVPDGEGGKHEARWACPGKRSRRQRLIGRAGAAHPPCMQWLVWAAATAPPLAGRMCSTGASPGVWTILLPSPSCRRADDQQRGGSEEWRLGPSYAHAQPLHEHRHAQRSTSRCLLPWRFCIQPRRQARCNWPPLPWGCFAACCAVPICLPMRVCPLSGLQGCGCCSRRQQRRSLCVR